MSYYSNLPIKSWAVEDRPREKLLQRGIEALTDAELIAILIGSGTRSLSALDLARMLLSEIGGLSILSRTDVSELTQIKGIGNAKALNLLAAFEVGRRKSQCSSTLVRVNSAVAVAEYLSPRLADLEQEVFYVLFLNRNHQIKAEKQLFRGGMSTTTVDARIVFKEAVQHLSSAIIIAHNHPSGNLIPSDADIEITQKLVEVGNIFDIPVIDHLIISTEGHFSFVDEGLM